MRLPFHRRMRQRALGQYWRGRVRRVRLLWRMSEFEFGAMLKRPDPIHEVRMWESGLAVPPYYVRAWVDSQVVFLEVLAQVEAYKRSKEGRRS